MTCFDIAQNGTWKYGVFSWVYITRAYRVNVMNGRMELTFLEFKISYLFQGLRELQNISRDDPRPPQRDIF
jgi:hypothetical protein